MGRMKEKFLDEQQQRDAEMQNQYLDDDYCCNEECGCHNENETNDASEYDAWWNSLSVEEKNKMYDNQIAFEKSQNNENK